MLFGYFIRDLQNYFDTLDANITKLTIDYNLLTWIYKIKPIYLYFENNDQVVFDLSRFSKLEQFEYNLQGIHYTRHWFIMQICCFKMTADISKGTEYFPEFKFHPKAPLTDIRMPYIVWNYLDSTINNLIYHYPTIKQLTVKDLDDVNMLKFPSEIEFIKLCDSKHNITTFDKFFTNKMLKGRITMIGCDIYKISPKLSDEL